MIDDGNPFSPRKIVEIELSQPLPDLTGEAPGRESVYTHALIMLRLHTRPIGVIEREMPDGFLAARDYVSEIWDEFYPVINEHLHEDGLSEISHLPLSGIHADSGTPMCILNRERFLLRAPFVSVLVATRDRPFTLARTLESLLKMEYPDFEILVIDNAPSDDSTAKFMAANYPDSVKVRYVREDKPGLACAHNRGLAEVNTPYVAITDDDVTVDRYWLAEMIKGFFVKENVGCVTGMIFPAEIQTAAQYLVEQSVGYAKGFNRQIFDMNGHRPNHPLFPYAAGQFGSGANMAFHTETIRKTGGFDDGLGVGSLSKGGDDLAAFFQIIVHGYGLVYEPAAIVYHQHYREYDRLRKQAYGYGAGLTAFLTKSVIDHPARLFQFVSKLPYGFYYAFNSRSPKNQRKSVGYPAELTRLERKGMLAGPLLYLRTRWQARQNKHTKETQHLPIQPLHNHDEVTHK